MASAEVAPGSPARSFGRVAADYERGRPDWPAEPLDRAVRALELGPEAEVVDLAAGTGKLTRRLAERFAGVTAIEPDDELRATLVRQVPGAASYAGAAERIPLSDACADAIFVGDAFHWFDSAAALDEIARVLRPGGGLALLWNYWWNEFEPPLPASVWDALRDVYVRVWPNGSPSARGDWRRAFPDPRFEPLREERFRSDLVLAADRVVSLWLTVSSVASLADDERDELARLLRAELSGSYRVGLTTELAWTRRR